MTFTQELSCQLDLQKKRQTCELITTKYEHNLVHSIQNNVKSLYDYMLRSKNHPFHTYKEPQMAKSSGYSRHLST